MNGELDKWRHQYQIIINLKVLFGLTPIKEQARHELFNTRIKEVEQFRNKILR